MRSKVLGALALGLLVVACGASTEDEELQSEGTEALTSDWTVIGTGVAYKSTGDGDAVFVGYAGYTGTSTAACGWTKELHRVKLKELGVGHLYCVQGPREASYASKEIGNSKLTAHLAVGPGPDAPFVLVAGHSSGAFVANELLSQLKAHPTVLEKVVYANLDGGGGLDPAAASKARKIAWFYAKDPAKGLSANAGAMQASGGGAAKQLTVTGSGCNAGAKWCLHDLLITTRPHNPNMFDLARDYTDFAGRPVQTGWIDALDGELR